MDFTYHSRLAENPLRVPQIQRLKFRPYMFHCTTDSRHQGLFSPNLLLEMDFPAAPGRVLVGDITALAALLHSAGGQRAIITEMTTLIAGQYQPEAI
jgi:hypothetical protein